MSKSSYSHDAYTTFAKSTVGKTVADNFPHTGTGAASPKMDPKLIKGMRESRDSAEFPNSLAIMLYMDQTGSMDRIPQLMINEALGTLFQTMLQHGVIDPQVFFGGIGDHEHKMYHGDYEPCPLQVGQFETGTAELVDCMTSLNIVGGGGGNAGESYLLAHFFAARHTSIDCFEKRGQKGILFTIGDEPTLRSVSGKRLQEIMGYPEEPAGITIEDILKECQITYDVFHIHVREGSNGRNQAYIDSWKKLLPERVIILEDYRKIAEVIATTVVALQGKPIADVTSGFDRGTALMVSDALKGVNLTTNKSVVSGSTTGITGL